MGKIQKILFRILNGASDNNIDFDDLTRILIHFDFELRVKGSHHIFTRSDIEEIVNIQPNGNKAKSYQVKQIRNIILQYKLSKDFDNE